MGRSDQGIDRVLNNIAAKLPGKEIWVTECVRAAAHLLI